MDLISGYLLMQSLYQYTDDDVKGFTKTEMVYRCHLYQRQIMAQKKRMLCEKLFHL